MFLIFSENTPSCANAKMHCVIDYQTRGAKHPNNQTSSKHQALNAPLSQPDLTHDLTIDQSYIDPFEATEPASGLRSVPF